MACMTSTCKVVPHSTRLALGKSFAKVPEDLQYCASTPVDAVSIDSPFIHQWKELGKKNQKEKSDDVGL